MKIELVKAWGFAAPGQVIDPAPGVALLLIERGIAKLADQPPFTDRWHKQFTQPPPAKRQEAQRGRK